jgi:predicted DNA-binding transcriptional regulator AlpA
MGTLKEVADSLWTVKQAAAFLGYHPGSLYRIIEQERAFPTADPIPFISLSSRAVRFDPVKLREWVDRRGIKG